MMGIYGSERKRAAIIFILYLICYVAFLGVNGMTAPSEIRYGEIPREMLAADDWVSPRLNGVRYFEKPVLGYWLGAASIGIFGENNFAVRLPSALAAGLMALAIYLFIGRAGANPREIPDGLSRADELAALIFLSSFGVFAMGSTAVLDSVFSFFITAFMILFFLMSEPGLAKKEKICLGALSGFFCACAFLTKGFLAVALPFAAIVPYSVWTGGHRNFPRDILLPMTVAVLAVLPWGVLIHLREPDFWRFFFWNEHVRRFLSDNAQHARSFWFFFAAAPLMALPWSFLTPSAFAGVISIYNYGGRLGRAVKFCVCWLVFPFLFLSMSRGKLFSYILPCFPPFAMLVALGLSRPAALSGKWRGRLFKWGLLANLIFFSALMILFLYLQFIGKNQPVYAQKWKAVMILNSFIFFAMCGVAALRSRHPAQKIWRAAIAPMFFFAAAHFLVPDATVEMKMPAGFLSRHAPEVSADTIIITDEDAAAAVCWYLKRDDVYVLGEAGELSYGFDYENSERHIDADKVASIISRFPGNVVLIAGAAMLERMEEHLPPNFAGSKSDFSGYLIWRRY